MENIKSWLEQRQTDNKSVLALFVKGYLVLSLLCFILLIIPWCHNLSIDLIDHFFFSVSIVSTTGLAPNNFVDSYNLLGQVISLIFIQLGGVGYMALSSFIIFRHFPRLPSLSVKLLKLEFNLPTRYPLRSFIYSVFIFTILIEIIGAILLYFGFIDEGIEQPLWNAIFHSVSAFCTAGFSLFDDSMSSFADNALITNTIMVLSFLGSIGFIVLLDIWLRITRKRKAITFTARIILVTTIVVWASGSLLIFCSDAHLFENGLEGLYCASFQSMSAHSTVGFNNYNIEDISMSSLLILIILMIIGASPAGTGGGIKTTSITTMLAVLSSVLKRRKRVTFLQKEIQHSSIFLAISSIVFYAFILLFGVWLITLVDGKEFSFVSIVFECASALSTVGVSTGITEDLSIFSKLIIAVLMFIGRLGVMTFGLALIAKEPLSKMRPEVEEVVI